MSDPLDFTLRVIESIAFSLHGVLGLTEPFTGCLRGAFQDGNAMPSWFWPVAGAILIMVAFANFSGNDTVVLAAQAYIATFHLGAAMYHVRLGHHPAVGLAPGIFAVFAFIVVTLRTNVLVALIGTVVCAIIALILCGILVKSPNTNGEPSLLDQDQQSPNDRAQSYLTN